MKEKTLKILNYFKRKSIKELNMLSNRSYFFLLGITIAVSVQIVSHNKDIKITTNENKIICVKNKKIMSEEIWKDSISNLLMEFRIKYPNIVLAQSILESGNFKSKVFLENHNPFGMKLPSNRCTTVLGIRNNHAYYKSVREAVIDYAFMQASYYKKAKTEEEYYNLLENYYCQTNNYVNLVKKVANSLK